MVNMKIFKTLLYCAYDLDVLHFEESETKVNTNINQQEIEQGCYILTNQGDVEIYVTKKSVLENGEIVVSYSATFKSNISSVDNHSILGLIKSQLETEAFLGNEHYKDIVCTCEVA